MSDIQPRRGSNDLADVVELLLDKGIVVNADIVVSVGDTELLGVRLRAAVASFETAAQYGLEFPAGTDPERVEAATGAAPRIAGQNTREQSADESPGRVADEEGTEPVDREKKTLDGTRGETTGREGAGDDGPEAETGGGET